MSTSNLAKAIGPHVLHQGLFLDFLRVPDSAFVDRADIIQYIGNPPREAIYEILRSSLCEFILRGLVQEVVSLHLST